MRLDGFDPVARREHNHVYGARLARRHSQHDRPTNRLNVESVIHAGVRDLHDLRPDLRENQCVQPSVDCLLLCQRLLPLVDRHG